MVTVAVVLAVAPAVAVVVVVVVVVEAARCLLRALHIHDVFMGPEDTHATIFAHRRRHHLSVV